MARFDAFSSDHDSLFNYSKFSPSNGSLASLSISDSPCVQKFRERCNRLFDIEKEKNQLIQDLLVRLDSTEKLLEQVRLDHNRETHYNREQQLRENQLQDQLRNVQSLMNRNAFIVVLLDGDGMIFDDYLIQKGEKGGKEAANLIWAAVNEFVNRQLPHLSSPKIVTRVYANVKGLSDALYKAGIIDSPATFEAFTKGFNDKLLFDFVDVGSGKKDMADEKISELFKLYLYDCHCHQIIFGCSHDNGYARLLEDTMADTQVIDHITLLEGMPFERELALLKSAFKTTKFDPIFRDTKLAVNYNSQNGWASKPLSALQNSKPLQTVTATLPPVGSNLSRVPSIDTSNTSNTGTPNLTWASMTAAPFVPTATAHLNKSGNTIKSPSASSVMPFTPGVDRNRLGQRVDKMDDTIPREDIQRVKKLKLCNVFFLQGASACNRSTCNHDHDYKLSRNDKKVLEQVARMTPCYYQTECDDAKCIYGHRCPQSKPGEKDCWYKEDCRFWGWGHGIDPKVVKTVKV